MGIAIRHPKDPRRPTVIPDAQYNPAVHVLWSVLPYGGWDTERPTPPLEPTGQDVEDSDADD